MAPIPIGRREVVAVVLLVVTGVLGYVGVVPGGVVQTVLLGIAGAYGLFTRRSEAKVKQERDRLLTRLAKRYENEE